MSYRVTLQTFYTKTSKGSKKPDPTNEEIDIFMTSLTDFSDLSSLKQYEALIDDIYFDSGYAKKPDNIEYLKNGIISYTLYEDCEFFEKSKGWYKIKVTPEDILEELMMHSLEDAAWEGNTMVYKNRGKEIGVFDYRLEENINISKND